MGRSPEAEREKRLVLEVKRGSVSAFEELYRSHVGRVYAICLRICRDEHRAQEVTQEVFLRAWSRIESFAGRSAFGSWLYSLASRASIDHLRREQRRGRREVETEDQEGLGVPAARTMEPGTSLDVESAIAALPPQARAVLVLHDVEGFRHQEIADMMGIATGTSKAHLFHARRLLREKLGS